MRIYKNCYELLSEMLREVFEMGHEVQTDTYQNKIIKGNPDFLTKEIINYSYCLESLDMENYLYLADPRMSSYVKAELLDRTDNRGSNPGNSWKMREDVWTQFLDKEGRFDYTYSERLAKQLYTVFMELNERPYSRQAILSIWDPKIDVENLGGKKRVPCSLHYQFLFRNDQLHIIYTMRSCDVMTHFGVDVALAWHLKEYMASQLNLKPGFLYHNIASLHSYKKDWPKLKQCIEDVKSSRSSI